MCTDSGFRVIVDLETDELSMCCEVKTARGILDGALLPTSSAPYLSISHPRGTVEAATGSEAKDEVEIKIDFTPRESFVPSFLSNWTGVCH